MNRTFIIVGIIIIVLAAFGVYAASMLQKRHKITQRQKFVKYNKRYAFWWDFPLSKHTFRKLYTQLGNLSVYNFMELHIVTVQLFERALLLSIAVFAIGVIGFRDVVSGLIMLAFTLVFLSNTLNSRIDDINYKTYVAMSTLLGSIRETYTRIRSISETLNECACPDILRLQLEQIHLIVSANNGLRRLQTFYDECPNRIMRTLATTCYIRNDAGDDKSEGSPFKDAIGLIKDEVDIEVRRLMKLRMMFSGLSKLPFVPLLLYPVGAFAFGYILPATQGVFESAIGYVIKITLMLTSFVCYYIISTMNNASAATVDDRIDAISWLLDHKWINKFSRTLVPRTWKKRHQLEQDLQGCLSQKSIYYISLERYIFAAILLVCSILITISIVFLSKISVRKSVTALSMTSTTTMTKEEKAAVIAMDDEILAQPEPPDDTNGDLSRRVKKALPRSTDLDLSNQVQRVIDKYNTYHALHFYWWFALIGIAFAILGYYTPILLLKLRTTMVNEEATIDVLQLQTIIAILMDTPLDTLSVVYWLMKSSDIHKNVLIDCYNDYTRDPLRALRDLRDSVTIPEFVQIADKLITTVYQVSMKEAFEDLVKDREGVLKIREMIQLDTLDKKRRRASPIAIAPTGVWMFVGFVLPIVWVAVKSAVGVLSQIDF